MWLHENLRVIQEDLSILMENGTKDKIFSFWIYLFEKLESICAINWVNFILNILFREMKLF